MIKKLLGVSKNALSYLCNDNLNFIEDDDGVTADLSICEQEIETLFELYTPHCDNAQDLVFVQASGASDNKVCTFDNGGHYMKLTFKIGQ